MKPSKSTFYVAVILSLLASHCLVSGQYQVYNRYRRTNVNQIFPLIIGWGVGYLLGRYLACEHCHACSEENDNTAAACTEEDGCEFAVQTGVSGTPSVCRCDEKVTSILKT